MRYRVLFVVLLTLCASFSAFADSQIDGLERKMTKKIGNAEFTINNAGEISLSINGKPLILKDGGSFSMRDADKKILYSSEWTKEPAVIDVKEEDGVLKIEASVEKKDVGRFVKKIVLRDGEMELSAALKRNAELKDVGCTYLLRLSPALADASFDIVKNGKKTEKQFAPGPGKIEWGIASGMSSIIFNKVLADNDISIDFPVKDNSASWHFDDLRAHSASNMKVLALRAGDDEFLKLSFSVNWRKHTKPETAPNIFPGDTSFETGPGFWLQQCGWAIDDTTATDGKKSLRLEAPFFSTCANGLMGSSVIELEKNNDYTFSVWMKGESEGQSVTLRIMRGDWANVAKTVKLSTEWKRFFVTLPKAKLDKPGNLWSVFFHSAEMKKIWLDAVKLEKGAKATDYTPSEPVGCSVISGVPGNIFLETEPVNFKLVLYNPSAEERIFNAAWEVKDSDSKIAGSGNLNIRLAPFELKEQFVAPFKEVQRGYFQFKIFAGGGEKLFSRESYFVVAPEPRKKGKVFAGIRCAISTAELSALPRLGCRWVSLSEMAGWDDIESQKGIYDKQKLQINDDAVSFARNLGLDIRLSIGQTPRWASTAPDKSSNFGNYPPSDFKPLTEFSRFMADRYKKEVQIWEVLGECDLSWRGKQGWTDDQAAQNVADFTKAVSEGVKASGSGARISACGVSGVTNNPFMEKIYSRCPRYIDDVDIHPYAGIRNIGPHGVWVTPEKNNLAGVLANVESIIGKYGSKTDYGVGELGYTLDVSVAPMSSFSLEHAAILQRSFLLSYAAGASRINWYCSYNNDEPFGYRYGIWKSGEGYQPLPAASAYAWSTCVLDAAQVVSNKVFAQAIQSLVLRQDDHAWLVLWNRVNDKEIELEFESGIDGLSSYNMFGAPGGTWNKNDKIKCIIGKKPIFFKCAAADVFSLENSINNGRMHVPPLDIVPSLVNSDIIKIELRNKVFAPVSGKLSVSVSEGWELKKNSLDFKAVPINGNAELFFKVARKEGSSPDTLTVKADVVTDKGNKISVSGKLDIVWVPRLDAKIKLDGDLSAWPGKPLKFSRESLCPPDILNAKIWKGEKDFSVSFYRAWDEKNLYLAFEVFDDIHYQKDSGRLMYKGDCIQIGIDSKGDAAPGEEYNSDDSEFGLALTPKGMESYCWVAGNGQSQDAMGNIPFCVKRLSDRTVYAAAIPWEKLSFQNTGAGSIFKMGFAVFDKDGANEATRWIELCRGIAGGKNPSAFKYFILEK